MSIGDKAPAFWRWMGFVGFVIPSSVFVYRHVFCIDVYRHAARVTETETDRDRTRDRERERERERGRERDRYNDRDTDRDRDSKKEKTMERVGVCDTKRACVLRRYSCVIQIDSEIDSERASVVYTETFSAMQRYRVAKTHRMACLYRSFSAKEPYHYWLFCRK